jgi:hypothetical protein
MDNRDWLSHSAVREQPSPAMSRDLLTLSAGAIDPACCLGD